MGVGGAEFVDVVIEGHYREGIEARIDLANLVLCGCQRLLLNNRTHVVALRTLANHSPVAGRILQLRGEQGHRRFLGMVKVAQLFNGLRSDQRGVPR